MTCSGCANNVKNALSAVAGVSEVNIDLEGAKATVNIEDTDLDRQTLEAAVTVAGYTIHEPGASLDLVQFPSTPASPEFNWGDSATWWQSANNTKWCLIGCSIGEFGTLGYYQWAQWPLEVAVGTTFFWFLVILPLINGLATSVALETVLLMRGQMDFSNALSTAFGMSFISMLAMEIAMELTDWLLTGGIGMTWWVILPMLVVGFLTPWPYNYWRLKKYGQACH
jgi:copper chaperone CopZ